MLAARLAGRPSASCRLRIRNPAMGLAGQLVRISAWQTSIPLIPPPLGCPSRNARQPGEGDKSAASGLRLAAEKVSQSASVASNGARVAP